MRPRVTRLVYYALMVCVLQATAQQTPTVSLRGIILESDVRRPMAKVTVEVRNNESGQTLYVATTGDDGRYLFPAVAPGRYRLTATRTGYVPAEYGQQTPAGPGMPIDVASGRSADFQITMTRTATIAGRIRDGNGLPLPNTEVQALRLSYEDGRRVLTVTQSTRANDLGEYRLFWLPPGRYYVSSVPMNANPLGSSVVMNASGRPPGINLLGYYLPTNSDPVLPEAAFSFGARSTDTEAFVPVYYPGTVNEDEAAAIELRPGADVRAADMVLSPVRPRRIQGVVMDRATQQPAMSAQILRSRIPPAGSSYFNDGVVPGTGVFEIPAVVPGTYALVAVAGGLSGRVDVEVRDRDIDGLVINVVEGVAVAGRTTIAGRATSGGSEMASLRVHLRPVPSFPGRLQLYADPAADGSFTLFGAQPGDYRVSVEPFESAPTPGRPQRGATAPGATPGARGGAPQSSPQTPTARGPQTPVQALPAALSNAYVQSIRLGNVDISNGRLRLDPPATGQPRPALEITIGTDGGSLQGTVMNSPNVSVVLAPNNPLRSRVDLYKTATTDASGKFRITGAAPGDYKVFAWKYADNGAWLDPEFMRPYEDRGASIHINAGASSTLEMSVIQ